MPDCCQDKSQSSKSGTQIRFPYHLGKTGTATASDWAQILWNQSGNFWPVGYGVNILGDLTLVMISVTMVSGRLGIS